MYFCASKASKPSTCELAALLYVVEEIGCAEHLAARERQYLYSCTSYAVKSTVTPKSRGVSIFNVLVKTSNFVFWGGTSSSLRRMRPSATSVEALSFGGLLELLLVYEALSYKYMRP